MAEQDKCGPYVLLTGASSGIGEAIAKLLSNSYNLILTGKHSERLAAVAQACSHQHDILFFCYDLFDVEQLAAFLTDYLANTGAKISSFIHCAGKTELLPIQKEKYHIGLKIMKINYFSAVEIISTLLKRRVNGDYLENIILVTSIAAAQGAPHQPHYCASKGALEALRITLARDLAPRVRVNSIAPGSFPTRMWETALVTEDFRANWKPPTLLPPGEVEEVAKAVRFLLSDDARYITGALLPVNGGEYLYR